MHFSAREKEIVIKIASGAIHDLPSYISEMVELRKEANRWSNFHAGDISISAGALVSMLDDEDALA